MGAGAFTALASGALLTAESLGAATVAVFASTMAMIPGLAMAVAGVLIADTIIAGLEAEVAVIQQFMDPSTYKNGVHYLDFSDLALWQKIGIHATGLSTLDYLANVQLN